MSKHFSTLARIAAILALIFIVYARFIATGDQSIDKSASPFKDEVSALATIEVPTSDKAEKVNALFAALNDPVDTDAIAQILAANAQIEIQDLEIQQSADEYVESLTQWQQSIKGGSIEHQFIAELEDGYEIAVCYRFSGGDSVGTKDSLSFDADTRISLWIQQAFEEACS